MGGFSWHIYVAVPVLMFLSYFLMPYYGAHGALRKYPGPTLASVSRLWLARASRNGVRSKMVHAEHLKSGTFVRIGPNE